MAEIQDVLRELESGKVRPVLVLVGTETLLIERAIAAAKAATVGDQGVAGFNEDLFQGDQTEGQTVANAARTMPMMADKRFVLVRRVDKMKGDSHGVLAGYLKDPAPESCVVLVAKKLDGNGKLSRAAKKEGCRFDAKALKLGAVRQLAVSEAKAKGHQLPSDAAHALVDAVGEDLSAMGDALERLSLYVGEGQPIGQAAVSQLVTRVRQETVWALVDALALRDLGAALSALDDAYDPRDHGLPLLGAVTWRVRQLIKFEGAMRHGGGSKAAAKAAGVAPFKASELQRTVRGLPAGTLERWLMLLAEADLALKGSRRPGIDVLGSMLVDMCRGPRV